MRDEQAHVAGMADQQVEADDGADAAAKDQRRGGVQRGEDAMNVLAVLGDGDRGVLAGVVERAAGQSPAVAGHHGVIGGQTGSDRAEPVRAGRAAAQHHQDRS
jgi:hypothetical protein